MKKQKVMVLKKKRHPQKLDWIYEIKDMAKDYNSKKTE